LFGFVRWTNLYFNAGCALHSDFIGGPLCNADELGAGILDIELKQRLRRSPTSFAHTWYWLPARPGAREHIDALRRAVDLRDDQT